VFLVRVASTAVATQLLGGNRDDVAAALSHAFLDGAALRTYRHAPNAGPRKSWAAGDAASRAVRLAQLTLAGEPGYPAALTTPTWGFNDVVLRGGSLGLPRPLSSYVMDNVLFKVSYPAEFHAQTALEAALTLHPLVASRLSEVAAIEIVTQESAVRIISKTGPLHNPADRDHCLQYIVAVGLLYGHLTAADYEDDVARDPRIDALRDVTTVVEDPAYTRDYLDPNKRSIANTVQVRFRDGSTTDPVTVEYPLGHRRRRAEALPLLREKFDASVRQRLPAAQATHILTIVDDPKALMDLPVGDFLRLFALPS
jgi:2-methylcitrate dehydratase